VLPRRAREDGPGAEALVNALEPIKHARRIPFGVLRAG
jgi:hypothetical protein